jgi:hypothetical protein
MAALSRINKEKHLAPVIDRFRDELVTTFPLDISGQVIARYRDCQFGAQDVFGPRHGVVYRMHSDGDNVRVHFGGRVITFPAFVHDALIFALTVPSYRISEVAGDLEDDEKIALVERLVREGLLVRK